MMMKKLEVKENSPEITCLGLIFRARVSTYADSRTGSIMFRQEVRLLKRKSCIKGCDSPPISIKGQLVMRNTCDAGMLDVIIEDIQEGGQTNIDNVENGKLYKAVYVEDGRDWETGIVDEYHFEFREVKEESNGG